MSKRIFTKEQVETLLQNQNVVDCSEKSIHYRNDFKILAVRKHKEGWLPSKIFIQARFNTNMIGYRTPEKCLYRWRKIFKDKGETVSKQSRNVIPS